jgi:hypothetical protein
MTQRLRGVWAHAAYTGRECAAARAGLGGLPRCIGDDVYTVFGNAASARAAS